MKAILLIDMPEHCFECPCCDKEYGCCDITDSWECTADNRAEDCPLIPLTEYEEARINEILKERENGTRKDRQQTD